MHKYDLVMSPHPFLSGLCDYHLRIIAEGAHLTHFPRNAYIFREGEVANRFYLIQHGKVSLESSGQEGAATPLQVLGDGDVLGWSWLFPPYMWHFDARALEETNVIALPGVRLRELCETDKTFGYEVMKRVANVVVHRLQAARLAFAGILSPAPARLPSHPTPVERREAPQPPE